MFLIPLLLQVCIYWWIAWRAYGFLSTSIRSWLYFSFSIIQSALIYLAIISFLAKYARSRFLALLFASAYFLLYDVYAAVLHHSSALPDGLLMRLADLTSIRAYYDRVDFALSAVWLLSSAAVCGLLYARPQSLSKQHLRTVMVLALVTCALPWLEDAGFRPLTSFSRIAAVPKTGIWRADQKPALRSVSRNPLAHLFLTFYYAAKPLELKPIADSTQFASLEKKWGLNFGKRHYPNLNLQPFEQIVVFGTESLSLDFLSPYNSRLPSTTSPFYGSQMVTQAMFTNYRCCALPTERGIAVTYNSHPNANALLRGNFDGSLIKILNRNGYHTVFLRSASEKFGNEDVLWRRLGFQEIIGLETLEKNARYRPFIEGWGMMDQVLYSELLDLMEKYRGQKMFIHVSGVDTHSPIGRENYGTLNYPITPSAVRTFTDDWEIRQLMQAVFRHDCDLGSTLARMKERGLLTPKTLVVLTADHNMQPSKTVQAIPGMGKDYYLRIPLAFLCTQSLPLVDLRRAHSQLDFAPTLLHLLNIPLPVGWWGESVFLKEEHPAVFAAQLQGRLMLQSGESYKLISLKHPEDKEESDLVHLYQTLFIYASVQNLNPDRVLEITADRAGLERGAVTVGSAESLGPGH